MTVALVLGGGGFAGRAFHLGVLGALADVTGRRSRRAGGPVAALPEPLPEPLPDRRAPLAPRALLSAARWPWAVGPGSLMGSLLPAGRTSTAMITRSLRRLHGSAWPQAL